MSYFVEFFLDMRRKCGRVRVLSLPAPLHAAVAVAVSEDEGARANDQFLARISISALSLLSFNQSDFSLPAIVNLVRRGAVR
jgi:hypothetical protein